jgi:hypothetical protein
MSDTSASSTESEGGGSVTSDVVPLKLSARQETRLVDTGEQKARAGTPVEMRLEWRVREVDTLLEVYKHKECLPSKPFLFPSAPNVLWQLDFYPNGRNEGSTGPSIHLSMMESMVSHLLHSTAPAFTANNTSQFSPRST